MAFVVLTELLGLYIAWELHQRNHWLYNISVPVSFLAYCIVFRLVFKNIFLKSLVTVLAGFFLLFALGNVIFLQGPTYFNSYTMIVGSIIVIALSQILLFQILRSEETAAIWLQPAFWIASALLFSFSGTLLYWILFTLKLDSSGIYFNWFIKSNIYVRYLGISISLLCFYRSPQVAKALSSA